MAEYRDDAVESAVLNDQVFLRVISQSTNDVAVLNDDSTSRVRSNALETAVLNDAVLERWWTQTVESAVLNDAVKTYARLRNNAVEAAVLNDALLSVFVDKVVEAAVLNDAAGKSEVTSRTVEAAVLNDLGDHAQHFRTNAVETAELGDLSPSRIANRVVEAAVLNDAVYTRFNPVDLIKEVAVLNDAISAVGHKIDLVLELAVLNDATTQHLHGADKVIEIAYISDYARGGEGSAWTADVEPLAMSRYDNFPFNSLAVVNGTLMGAGPGGVFALTGDTDAGVAIQAEIVGDWTDRIQGPKGTEPDPKLKRPRYVYLNTRVDGVLAFVLGCLEDGGEVDYSYSLPDITALGFVNNRAPLGRGIRSRYLRPVIRNVSGADFEINDGTVVVDSLARSL